MSRSKTDYELIDYCREPLPEKRVCSACYFANCRRSIIYITKNLDTIRNQIWKIRVSNGPIPQPVEIRHGRSPINLSLHTCSMFKKIVFLDGDDFEDGPDYGDYFVQHEREMRRRRYPAYLDHGRKPLDLKGHKD